jgi:uncharacterized membrane protein
MPESLKIIADSIAICVEVAGALLVAYGAGEAVYGSIVVIVKRRTFPTERKAVWLRFGGWLLLGLEFALAADVVRSALSPTWQDIGELAAIAAIRTFLSLFLQRDLEKYETRQSLEKTTGRP